MAKLPEQTVTALLGEEIEKRIEDCKIGHGEAELKAELVNTLALDRPEHTAYVLALLAEALCVEARSHRAPAAEAVATMLALNDLQHALGDRLVKVLTYEEAGPPRPSSRGCLRRCATSAATSSGSWPCATRSRSWCCGDSGTGRRTKGTGPGGHSERVVDD